MREAKAAPGSGGDALKAMGGPRGPSAFATTEQPRTIKGSDVVDWKEKYWDYLKSADWNE
jgi:hypothetical protein